MFAKQILGLLFIVAYHILCQLHGLPRSKAKHLFCRKIHRNGHKQSCIIDSFMRLNSVNFFNLIPLDPVYMHIWTMTSYPFQAEILGFSLVIWPIQIPKCQELLVLFCFIFFFYLLFYRIPSQTSQPMEQFQFAPEEDVQTPKTFWKKMSIFCYLCLSWYRLKL